MFVLCKMPVPRGMSMLTILIAIGICSILATIISKITENGFSGQKSLTLRDDLRLIRSTIFSQIDCAATFAAAGIDEKNPGLNCTSHSTVSGQMAPFLRLRRAVSAPCPTGSDAPNSCWLTGPLAADGSAALLDWRIRATCSQDDQTLVIRVAKIKGGDFGIDPLNGLKLEWNQTSGLIAGSLMNGGLPLCFTSSSGIGKPAFDSGWLDLRNLSSLPSGVSRRPDAIYPFYAPYHIDFAQVQSNHKLSGNPDTWLVDVKFDYKSANNSCWYWAKNGYSQFGFNDGYLDSWWENLTSTGIELDFMHGGVSNCSKFRTRIRIWNAE